MNIYCFVFGYAQRCTHETTGVLTDALVSLFGNSEGSIDKTAVWTALLAIVTVFLLCVAWVQLSSIKETAKADFLKRLNDSFFTENTRNLIVLLSNSAIDFKILPIKDISGFKIDELPYLEIRDSVLKQLMDKGVISLPEWRKGYNAFEIDDFLLGPLDDVGRYEMEGLLDIVTTYKTFSYYVQEVVAENKAIRGYLKDSIDEDTANYDDLEYLYKEFVSYEKISNKGWLIKELWKIGHKIRRSKVKKVGISEREFSKDLQNESDEMEAI